MQREREREREREKFIDNQIDDSRSVSTTPLAGQVTPPLGTRGPAYGGECYTPTLRLALWHAFQQHSEREREIFS